MDLRRKTLRTLDLFSGCGGMSLGLANSNSGGRRFQCVGAIDDWAIACETFESIHKIKPERKKVTKSSVESLLSRIGDVDVVVGGPPCQGFSTSGKRALDDPRNRLVKNFLTAVELAAPSFFLMENVTGFTSYRNGRLLRETREYAENLGYEVSAGIMLATRVGVPQRRRRLILVGSRLGRVDLASEHCELDEPRIEGLEFDQRECLPGSLSFEDATSDLPVASHDDSVAPKYLSLPKNEFQRRMRAHSGDEVFDHISPRHSKKLVALMKLLEEGQSAVDPEVKKRLPEDLIPTSGFANSYSRIVGSKPAPTITRNFMTPSSANCIHPSENRALTLREAARCQSFPDHISFKGTSSERRLQIGNAVPPLLAEEVGNLILESITIPGRKTQCD